MEENKTHGDTRPRGSTGTRRNKQLGDVLQENHQAFALEEDKRGETPLMVTQTRSLQATNDDAADRSDTTLHKPSCPCSQKGWLTPLLHRLTSVESGRCVSATTD